MSYPRTPTPLPDVRWVRWRRWDPITGDMRPGGKWHVVERGTRSVCERIPVPGAAWKVAVEETKKAPRDRDLCKACRELRAGEEARRATRRAWVAEFVSAMEAQVQYSVCECVTLWLRSEEATPWRQMVEGVTERLHQALFLYETGGERRERDALEGLRVGVLVAWWGAGLGFRVAVGDCGCTPEGSQQREGT